MELLLTSMGVQINEWVGISANRWPESMFEYSRVGADLGGAEYRGNEVIRRQDGGIWCMI